MAPHHLFVVVAASASSLTHPTPTNRPCATRRAVFGYVQQSNELEVVATGGGLEDLSEELNSCKIMYAFVRVIDPNT